jgi:hypothetical protein
LVVSEEVDSSVIEVVEVNILEAGSQGFIDGMKFSIKDFGGGSHRDNCIDFLW